MADSGALPAGFGELEVLAVGTVLLVEGEPGKRWVEWGPGAPDAGHSSGGDKEPDSSVPTPMGHPAGAPVGCRLQLGAKQEREREREAPGPGSKGKGHLPGT